MGRKGKGKGGEGKEEGRREDCFINAKSKKQHNFCFRERVKKKVHWGGQKFIVATNHFS